MLGNCKCRDRRGYTNGDTVSWSAVAGPWNCFVASAFPVHKAVIFFKREPQKCGDKQRYQCSHEERPNGLAALIQLLQIHSKYGSGKIDRYVNKSQDCD